MRRFGKVREPRVAVSKSLARTKGGLGRGGVENRECGGSFVIEGACAEEAREEKARERLLPGHRTATADTRAWQCVVGRGAGQPMCGTCRHGQVS